MPTGGPVRGEDKLLQLLGGTALQATRPRRTSRLHRGTRAKCWTVRCLSGPCVKTGVASSPYRTAPLLHHRWASRRFRGACRPRLRDRVNRGSGKGYSLPIYRSRCGRHGKRSTQLWRDGGWEEPFALRGLVRFIGQIQRLWLKDRRRGRALDQFRHPAFSRSRFEKWIQRQGGLGRWKG